MARLLYAGRKAPLPVRLPEQLSMPSNLFTDYGANWHMPAQGAWALRLEESRRAIVAAKAKRDFREE